jgi:lipocalin
MTDFYNPSETRKARKDHRCTYCGEVINKGDDYTFQKGHYDGAWYELKMHPECWEDQCENGDGEYTLYSNERPQVEGGAA